MHNYDIEPPGFTNYDLELRVLQPIKSRNFILFSGFALLYIHCGNVFIANVVFIEFPTW